jgi:hypothetical protein
MADKAKKVKNIPVINRAEQITQMQGIFPGARLKSVKDENGIVSLEFETIGVIIFANPSAIGLGLYNPPAGEKPNV